MKKGMSGMTQIDKICFVASNLQMRSQSIGVFTGMEPEQIEYLKSYFIQEFPAWENAAIKIDLAFESAVESYAAFECLTKAQAVYHTLMALRKQGVPFPNWLYAFRTANRDLDIAIERFEASKRCAKSNLQNIKRYYHLSEYLNSKPCA